MSRSTPVAKSDVIYIRIRFSDVCNNCTKAANYKGVFCLSVGNIKSWLKHHKIANILSIPVLKKLGPPIMFVSDNDF